MDIDTDEISMKFNIENNEDDTLKVNRGADVSYDENDEFDDDQQFDEDDDGNMIDQIK